MSPPIFFARAVAPTLRDIVAWTGAETVAADLDVVVTCVAPIDEAGRGALCFLENARYVDHLAQTRATACLVSRKYADRTPAGTAALVTREPYRAFAIVVGKMFPDALTPPPLFATAGIAPGAFIHPDAKLEDGVVVDPGAVIGARAEIGSGTRIAAHAVIGRDVRIGRDCSIGAHGSIVNALIGDRVILHPGVRIGQDGFGFAMSPRGHLKVPQIGRVIIQNDVEIGANATIDRGATRDTVIGEGTKIDNLVQIGHNVTIGRHCVIVSQVGVSGSTAIGDFVAIGGQAGFAGHLTIGAGAQIGAQSGVMHDVPAGERWAGYPAVPSRLWLKMHLLMERLAKRHKEPDPETGTSHPP